jgi:hypothetical protein
MALFLAKKKALGYLPQGPFQSQAGGLFAFDDRTEFRDDAQRALRRMINV